MCQGVTHSHRQFCRVDWHCSKWLSVFARNQFLSCRRLYRNRIPCFFFLFVSSFTLYKIGQSLSVFSNEMKFFKRKRISFKYILPIVQFIFMSYSTRVKYCYARISHRLASSKSVSASSSFVLLLHIRHLQQTIQGAASSSNGDATNNSNPKPAKIPMTCARCHTTEAREWPNLFLQGPLS